MIVKINPRWQAKSPNGTRNTRGHINRTISYALREREARVIGGQGLEYDITNDVSAYRAGRDMEGMSDLNPSAPGPRPYPLHHMSLSWPHGENPTDEHMTGTARSVLKALGMDRAKAVFVRHLDTEHQHMHVISSRVDPETGSVFESQRGYNKERVRVQEWARSYEREHQRERTIDRSWLKTPENFREFADAHGLGRLDPREAEKIKNDHANERMLSDFDYFSKLDRDKPERAPTLEHQNENTEGMPFYSPAGAKVVNRVLNEREPTDWSELEPVEKVAIKRDRLERGMGREMDIFGFDDGASRGESGYGGD